MYVTDENEADNNEVTDSGDPAAAAAGNQTNEAADEATSTVAKAEFDAMKTELFAKLEAISKRLDEQPAHVPATDTRKPNNAASVTPDLADLSPVARIAAGYKS